MSTAGVHQQFAAVLLRRQVIDPDQLVKALHLANCSGIRLDEALVRLGDASAEQVMRAWAEALRLEFIDLIGLDIPLSVIEMMPESVARENLVLPLAQEGRVFKVVLCDPDHVDTVQKLQFILNKDIRVVLATREQVVWAIGHYYGESETESVDSMLAEFTDTAIDFTETEYAPATSPSGIDLGCDLEALCEESRGAVAASLPVERRATVRYYHRMNPERLFPLLVVLSRQAVLEVARRGVSQAQSKTFQVAEESVVEVEPVLPGCACYPPKEQVRIGPGDVTVTFWVVPHVLGKLSSARVVVRQEGDTLAEVPLEVRVVKQSLTLLMGSLSLVLPFGLLLLKHFKLDFETQMAEGFGLYARLAGWLLEALTPEILTGLLVAATVGLYLWLRPRKRDVFWDVKTAGGKETPRVRSQPADQTAPLERADHYYQAREYAAALAHYEKALAQGTLAQVHYFRASLAASLTGKLERALAILQEAEKVLPAAEIRGPMWYNLGCFAARLGRFGEAVRYLTRAVDAGVVDAGKYRSDPDLEALRWNPHFKQLLAELGS
jgi:hypothetical protein